MRTFIQIALAGLLYVQAGHVPNDGKPGNLFLEWNSRWDCSLTSDGLRICMPNLPDGRAVPTRTRACLQLGVPGRRTDQNQILNVVLWYGSAGMLGIPKSVVE